MYGCLHVTQLTPASNETFPDFFVKIGLQQDLVYILNHIIYH